MFRMPVARWCSREDYGVLWKYTGVGPGLRVDVHGNPIRLDALRDGSAHRTQVKRWCDNVYAEIHRGTGLVLVGETGQGKTSAAVICCAAVLRAGGFPFFIRACEYVSAVVRQTEFSDTETIEERARTAHLLVLDDVGAGAGRDQAGGMIEALLRHRLSMLYSTIVTAHSPQSLAAFVGEATARQLLGRAPAVMFVGERFHEDNVNTQIERCRDSECG